MKTVKYQGKEFEVSDWVNFIATDKDGTIWGFANKPELNIDENMWSTSLGRYEHVDHMFSIIGEIVLKKFNYYILAREVRKYNQKVRQLVHINGNRVTLRLTDNLKTFDIDELIGISSFVKGDILTNSEISSLYNNTFVAVGGNHKYTKVLRMSDGKIITVANIEFKKVGSVYEKV